MKQESVDILVRITRDVESNRVMSIHQPATEKDQEILNGWVGGGQEQVAFGLLCAAIEREAIVSLLFQASTDSEWLPMMRGLSPDDIGMKIELISKAIESIVAGQVSRLTNSVVKDALKQFDIG